MNTFIRIAIVLLLACSLAAAGSAFKVESAEVSPDGDLQAGVPVEVSAVIDFPASSGTTFPSSDMLSLYSEVDNPRWQWSVEISGHENPKPDGNGKFFKISGFELEYPKESRCKLRLKLDGTAPDVKVSQNITVLRIQQLDRSSKVVENSEYTIIRRVVNPADLATRPRQGEIVARGTPHRDRSADRAGREHHRGRAEVRRGRSASEERRVRQRLGAERFHPEGGRAHR